MHLIKPALTGVILYLEQMSKTLSSGLYASATLSRQNNAGCLFILHACEMDIGSSPACFLGALAAAAGLQRRPLAISVVLTGFREVCERCRPRQAGDSQVDLG